jgi:tetratricopeptide (TPR) repeat protein
MRKLISTLITAAALVGCSSHSSPPPKAQVVKQWNDARSGVLMGLARDQYENGAFDKSRQTLDEAIKLSPDSEPAHVLSAKLFIEAGQLEPAERELAVARQLNPADAAADYLSGVVYQRWQQPERALEFYQHACDKSPAELAYVMAKAETLVAMGRRADALAMLQERVAYFEHSGAIRDEVGLLLIQEKRYDEAVQMLRRASILAADDQNIREHLAMALFDDEQYQDAADILTSLMQQEQNAQRADLLATLGECQLQIGRPADAVANLQQAAALLPSSAGVWLSLAKADVQIGALRPADVALAHSLAQDSNNGQSWLLLGYLRLRQARNADALDAFCKASQRDPDDTVSLCMVGVALEKLGRTGEAAACFNKAMRIDPRDEMAAQLMARLNLHE